MIGLIIAKLLKANTDLVPALVATNNIFPYAANEDTPLPFIVYTIDSIESEYNKDGWAHDIVSFSVISFSDDYAKLQDIVSEVRTALDFIKDTNTGYIYLIGMVEDYVIENIFFNKLSFKVEVNKY